MAQRIFAAWSMLFLLLVWAGSARGAGAVWNQLEFGTPLADFLRRYPTANAAVPDPAAAAALPAVSYTLSQQKFGPLESCNLEFSFAGKDRVLYRVQARCASEPADVLRYLTARYGNPIQANARTVLWRQDGVEVTFQPKSGVFTVSDLERSRSVAASLMRLLGQVPVGPTGSAGPGGSSHEKKP
ncbi:MAG: hypothetical protein KatS3mg077_3180 [Candidatus Binatia bacterium]|nr:MAG: hypothetical protein KatS3mg077_3180 [Candidatus Binatia bacterium]